MPDTPESDEPISSDEMPSAEALSYSHRDIRLSRSPVDWEMLEPKVFETLPPEEREALLREENRRLYFAVQGLAKELAPLLRDEEGDKLSDRINMILNPDQYPHTSENPRVEPSEDADER
jgi:hypothetical protein